MVRADTQPAGEKAIAVFQKKAENSMCLPYALSKAESMSNVVMDVTPNLIFIIDREMRIRGMQ